MTTLEMKPKEEERDGLVTASGLSDPMSSGNGQQGDLPTLEQTFWVSQKP